MTTCIGKRIVWLLPVKRIKVWESFHFGCHNNQTVKQVSENLAELSEHIEVVYLNHFYGNVIKLGPDPELGWNQKNYKRVCDFFQIMFLDFCESSFINSVRSPGFWSLAIMKLCDLLLLVPCQLLFAQAHMILFVWTYMISSLQVYDASGSLIPCQVNPVMTSEGIASSKYEVKSPHKMCSYFQFSLPPSIHSWCLLLRWLHSASPSTTLLE